MMRKKFFKQFLPLLLSVALAFQSLPNDVYAAETDTEQTVAEAVEEVVDSEEDIVLTEDAETTVDVEEELVNDGIVTPAVIEFTDFYNDALATCTYAQNNENPFDTLLSHLKSTGLVVKSEDKEILVDSNDIINNSLDYIWSEDKDGKVEKLAEGTVPVNAGSYLLEVKPKENAVISAETLSINCVINKYPLKYVVDWDKTLITNRTTVGDLKAQVLENAYFEGMPGIDPSRYVDDSQMSIIVKLANQDDSAALKDDAIIDRLSEVGYVFKISAPTADDNYEVIEEYSPVRFNDRVPTKVDITWPATADKNWVEYTYTGKAVAVPAVKTVFDFTVVTDVDGEESEEVKYDDKEVECYFADVYGDKLDTAPVDAGSYKYVISYTDSTGVYESSINSFDVIINPAYITVSPSIDASLSFFYGQTAADVLANVEYSVDGFLNGEEFDKNTFWGVSVGNQNVTQPFEPVFAVQQKDTNDKNADWETISNYSSMKKGFAYRIVLTGYKAVYGANAVSTSIDDTSVHAAERNYVVNKADLYQAKQVYDFTNQLKETTDCTIDATDLLLKDKNGSDGLAMEQDKDGNKKLNADKIFTKIYDGVSLYATRSDYKKAVLKDASGKVLDSVKSSDLTYIWYSFELITMEVDGNKVNLDSNKDNPWSNNSTYKKTKYDQLPKDAGWYELEISYTDAAAGIAAEPVVIYFHIEPQMLKLSVSEEAIPGGEFSVYAKDTIDHKRLVESISENCYKLMVVSGNDLDANVLSDSGFTYNSDFNVYADYYNYDGDFERIYDAWSIYESTTVKDYEDVDSVSYNLVDLSSKSTYELGLPYRARANVDLWGDLANNYMVVADSYKINVKQMGNIALRFELTDEAKELVTEKVYDKEGFNVSYNGLVKAYTQIGDEDVTDKIDIRFYWLDSNGDEYENCPSSVGDYRLYCEFTGNDTYNKLNAIKIADFKIVPRKVTITPVSSNDIIAGLDTYDYHEFFNDNHAVSELLNRVNPFTIEIEQVEGTPVYEDYLLSTILPYALDKGCEIDAVVTNKVGASNRYLRYGVTYSLKIDDTLDWIDDGYYDSCDGIKTIDGVDYFVIKKDGVNYYWNMDNYEFIYDSVEFTVNVRSHSIVTETSDFNGYSISKTNTKLAKQGTDDDGTVIITPISGIPYFNDTYFNYDSKTDSYVTEVRIPGVIIDPRVASEGNYAIVKIQAPQEFCDLYDYYYTNHSEDATFYNSIKEADGYVVGYDKNNGTTTVAFFIEPDAEKKAFEITWEDGYTEKFVIDLSQSALLSDIFAATEPKTLAFNVANKTMIVGNSQHLDVKITKKLHTDIVDLRYRVISGTAVSVTPDGYVTAVEVGKAVVEVYPVYYDETGAEKEFDTWKKTVKVTLNVKNVSAPKIKSTYAYDDRVTIKYQIPNDGYRQEVYIVPGKGVKPAEIESKIDAMKAGKFDGAAYVLDAIIYINNYIYVNGSDKYNDIDYTKKIATITVGGLAPNQDYTVYVRNVSAMEELVSGEVVVLSAAGSTKPIHSQKAQLDNIWTVNEGYVDNDNYPDPDFEEHPHVTTITDSYINKTISGNCYSVSLNQKTVQLTSYGDYEYLVSNMDAEYFDRTQLLLPITKEEAENYQAPKLSYFAVSDVEAWSYTKSKTYSLKIGDRFYAKSAIATVDKKGKVTLKGVGLVDIIAYDSYTGTYSFTQLVINSPLTSITAKNVKVAVGNDFDPVQDSYLTFYDGKTKVINGADYFEKGVWCGEVYYENDIDVTVESGTGLVQIPNKNEFYVKEAGQTVTLKITPKKYPAAATTMTVTTTAMSAIKGLKAYDVTDCTAKVKFNFAASDRDHLKFDLRVTDAKNQLIYTEIIQANWASWYANNADYLDNYQYSAYDSLVYIADKNLYIYNLRIDECERQANLKISLTPIFDNDVIGKTAQTKFKTTNAVSSYVNHLNVKKNMTSDDPDGNPNATPKIAVRANDENHDAVLSNVRYLTSNNTFKLDLYSLDKDAINTGSDIVRWKSTNTKVATVKAVGAGSSATLKTLRAGETYIECTSKLTKKIICRYKLYVKAAGDGEYTYGVFNDFDDVQPEDLTYEQINGAKLLTEKNPVRLPAKSYMDYVLIKFVAPSDGFYEFESDDYLIDDLWMDEGEVIYRYVNCNPYYSTVITVQGTHYTRLNVGAEAKGNVVFYAPNAGTYAVYEVENGTKVYKKIVALKAAEQYAYSTAVSTTVGIESISLIDTTSDKIQVSELEKNEVKFVTYTAPYSGNYVFTSKDSVSKNIAKSYTVCRIQEDGTYYPDSINVDNFNRCTYNADGSWNLDQEITLNTGDIIIIKLVGGEDKASTQINVTKPAIEQIEDGKEMSYVNSVGETTWYKYSVDDYETLYKLTVIKDSVSSARIYYSVSGINSRNYEEISDGQTINLYGHTDLEDVKEVYVKVVPTVKDQKATAKFTFTKVIPTELNDTKNFDDPSVSANTVNYYSFTAPSYGVYEWSVVATDGTAYGNKFFDVIRYNDGFGYGSDSYVAEDTDQYHDEISLQKGETIYFTVNGTYSVTEASKTIVRVKPIEPTVVKENVETDIKFAASNKNTYQYYKFTAATDATYKLSFTDVSANMILGYSKNGINNRYTNITDTKVAEVLLNAGSSVIIRVKVTNALEAKAKLKVTDITSPAFVSGKPVTISENGTSFVKRSMIVDEPSRFMVTYDLTKFAGTQVVIDGRSYGDGEEFVITRVGTKLDITISNTASKNEVDGKYVYTATPTVKIEKVVPQDIALDKKETVKVSYSASIANSRYQWFKFVVPESGRYKFDIADTTEANEVVRYVAGSITETNMYDIANLNDAYLIKGMEYYISAGVTAPKYKDGVEQTQTYELTITKNKDSAEVLKLDEKSTDITISQNTAYFTFTAPADDYYTFDLVSGNGLNRRYIATATNLNGFVDGAKILKLRAGDVVSVRVTASNANEKVADNVIVKKLEYTVVEADKTVEAKFTKTKENEEEKLYFLFKYPESGTAEYGFTKVSDGVKLSAANVYGAYNLSEIATTNFASVYGTVNNDNLFYVTATTEKGDAATVDLKISMITYEEIDEAEVKIDKNKGERYYYNFKPSDAGRYVISIEDVTEPLTSRVVDSDVYAGYGSNYYRSQLNSTDFVSTEEMVFDGVDNYVQGYVYTVSANIRTTLSFKKVKATETLALVSDNKIVVDKDEVKWASYEVPETGYYSIKSTANVSANAAIYSRMDTLNSESSYTDVKLTKGQTVYVRVENTGTDKTTQVVSISSRTIDKVNANDTFTVNKAEDGKATEKFGIFTADADGYYTISAKTPVSVAMTVSTPTNTYNVYWNSTEVNTDGNRTYTYDWTSGMIYLLNGQEVTFDAVNSNTENDAAVTLDIKKVATFDDQKIVNLNGKDGYTFYYASEEGTYRFVSATPGTTVYYQIDSNDADGYDNLYGESSLYVRAGHYVFFKLENNNASESNKIQSTIGVYKPATVKEGEAKLEAGDVKSVTFVAPHSTYYMFSTGAQAKMVISYVEDGETKYIPSSSGYIGSSYSVKLTEGTEYTFTFENNNTSMKAYTYTIERN